MKALVAQGLRLISIIALFPALLAVTLATRLSGADGSRSIVGDFLARSGLAKLPRLLGPTRMEKMRPQSRR